MDEPPIPEEEKKRVVSALIKMMEMGMGAVYGEEDENVLDAQVECVSLMDRYKAKCCTFTFALTKDEVEAGKIDHNQKKPFFIARDEDGYCPHLERYSMKCSVWDDRPLRCRRYDCTNDPHVWGKSE
jgi:Fe-S-cluster containining protein